MKAAVFTGFGGPSNVEIQDIEESEPEQGEVVLDVGASSINHHDYWYLKGESVIDSSDLPFLSGVDVAGTVARTTEDVTSVSVGDRVVLNPMQTCGSCEFCREGPENLCTEYGLYHGGFAEKATVPANRLVSIPKSVSITEAAALPVAYMTAWRMIKKAEAGPADSVLIPGATGGVGVAAVQLLQSVSATTVGTTTKSAKLEQLESIGVDRVIQVTSADELPEKVAHEGRYQVVINHLGGDYTEAGLSALARNGRMVICGATAGPTGEFDVRDLFLRHKRIIGSTMGTHRDLRQVVELVAEGEFSPEIDSVYSLEETAIGFQQMRDQDQFGKLIIEP